MEEQDIFEKQVEKIVARYREGAEVTVVVYSLRGSEDLEKLEVYVDGEMLAEYRVDGGESRERLEEFAGWLLAVLDMEAVEKEAAKLREIFFPDTVEDEPDYHDDFTSYGNVNVSYRSTRRETANSMVVETFSYLKKPYVWVRGG